MKILAKISALFYLSLFINVSIQTSLVFGIDPREVDTTINTLRAMGVDPNTVVGKTDTNVPNDPPDLNDLFGYMGETKITKCSEVPEDQPCPSGQCEIGGGGGKKKCAYWPPCPPCPTGTFCVDRIPGCNKYCSKYEKIPEFIAPSLK